MAIVWQNKTGKLFGLNSSGRASNTTRCGGFVR